MSKTNQGSFRTKQIPFTQVPNTLIRDKNISLKAKGLYMLIQSYITIPNFILYKSYLMKQCTEGEKAFDSAWSELKKAGYLKQYKYKDKENSYFTYEYDLLDVPEIDIETLLAPKNNITAPKIPDPHFGGVDPDPQNAPLEKVDLQKGGCINNTEINKTNDTNTILSSYQYYENEENKNDKIRRDMITEEECQSNIETLASNIEPEIMKQKYPGKEDIIDEIFNIMCDTVNSNSEYIRISGDMKPTVVVKKSFLKLDSDHFEYILECLANVSVNIKNPRAYMLATIYNSYYTYNNAVSFNFNRDFKDTMFVCN